MEIRVLTSNSTRGVLEALAHKWGRASGNKVALTWDSAKAMLARIREGEKGDIVVLTENVVNELASDGVLWRASCRRFAAAKIGMAVRKDAPKPDISTVDALRSALLAAQSVAHTLHGASGMYVPVLLERLGIAAEMQPKIVNRPGGYIAEVVAKGEAEVALQQMPELLAVHGVDIVGPLPDEVQKLFVTSAGVFADSAHPGIAEAFLHYVLAPAQAAAFRQKGFEPPAAA